MRILFLLLFLSSQTLFADLNITHKVHQLISEFSTHSIENNISQKDIKEESNLSNKLELEKQLKQEQRVNQIKIQNSKFIDDLKEIEESLKDNIWSKVYSNYETYKKLELLANEMFARIKSLKKKRKLTKKEKKALKKYEDDFKTTNAKLTQLKEYKDNPFKKLLTPDDMGETPNVSSPLDLVNAISFKKKLTAIEEDYSSRLKSLKDTVYKLNRERYILSNIIGLNKELNSTDSDEYIDKLDGLSKRLDSYKSTLDVFNTTQKALNQKISEKQIYIKEAISKQIEKGIVLGSIILFLFLVFLILKYLVRKYMSENELYYSTNKALNFIFITIVVLILLFSYLENVGHLVTILSFASAGIAIALKDWFMSIMGWFVIIFSGSLHVGDRVKFLKDGKQYVGDIVDISLLRMTIHEDVTLTTYEHNRRAGRIIFVPNNYIFTEMIANYSHAGIKTVWDGIDFVITFDSDVVKAQSIAKEVTRQYSKGYTDMTRKQLNKLRSKYSMRNTSVEPRIFAFLDDHGIRISIWYLTNAYATLTLRSTISMEIFNRIREEDRISMAYPSQSLYMNRPAPKELKPSSEIYKEKFNSGSGDALWAEGANITSYGSFALVDTVVDTTPDSFSFSDQTNVAVS
ncbi:MAG TPA: mechanosensitive ion channel, partial [Campylobacterales bacterium]|nr:mechanosensitive ion channel [Campylobacterales bacterium]